MENTTKMLAKTILITLENQKGWVSEPRFETLDVINDIRKRNTLTEKKVDEDGEFYEEFKGYLNDELEEKLKMIEISFKRDLADYERYKVEKIKTITKNLDIISQLVEIYSDEKEEEK
nr:MAG TPA: hypothetical protein [Caudoviricetes sp.]